VNELPLTVKPVPGGPLAGVTEIWGFGTLVVVVLLDEVVLELLVDDVVLEVVEELVEVDELIEVDEDVVELMLVVVALVVVVVGGGIVVVVLVLLLVVVWSGGTVVVELLLVVGGGGIVVVVLVLVVVVWPGGTVVVVVDALLGSTKSACVSPATTIDLVVVWYPVAEADSVMVPAVTPPIAYVPALPVVADLPAFGPSVICSRMPGRMPPDVPSVTVPLTV
jgi:hypothetical protein